MSSQEDKLKKTERIHSSQVKIDRQSKIAKLAGADISQPHRFAKRHALNCGDPKCFLCMNPRKAFGEKTIQERKFDQIDNDTDYHLDR